MSKFQPLTAYDAAIDGQYQLLPFKFTALTDESHVLTNMVGEYVVVPREKVKSLIRHTLKPTDPHYHQLKSKHFLRDADSDVAFDLLALKTRTRYQRLADFTALHIFVVSLRCEHSCPYCQVSRQSDDRASFDMTEATATKALDLVFRSPSPVLKIEFQGGEPLLNLSLIKFVVEAALQRNREKPRPLQFVITTNLALLSDDALQFCKANDILISTSLDGPADLHNANRPRPGRDSYERATAGIARVREALGPDGVSALMTTTRASLGRAREIVDEYIQQGFRNIFFRALSPYGFAIKTKTYAAYDTEEWLQFYFEGLRYIVELNRSGQPFVESYAATILTKMLTPFATGYVDLMSPAGIGIAAVVYNYDGDVYAFMGKNPDAADNRWLREAFENRIPIIYFLGISPGRYEAVLPAFISAWDREALKARVVFGIPDQGERDPPHNAPERRYALRLVKQRLHQASFREAVITAYQGRCALSRFPEPLLIDAAHIVSDKDEKFGHPVVPNGIPLSKIHHAAFDAHLIGIDPDYRMHVSNRLLSKKDGPMLEAIKDLNGVSMLLPDRIRDRPDRERLAIRFKKFKELA